MSKKASKLDALPDGKIDWADSMVKLKDSFKNGTEHLYGIALNPESSFAENHTLVKQRPHAYGEYYQQFTAARMLLLSWHQSDAYDAIFEDLRQELNNRWVESKLLDVVLQIHDARAIDELLPYVGRANVNKVLIKQATRWPLFVLKKLLSYAEAPSLFMAMFILELLAKHPDWLEPLQASCNEAQKGTLAGLLDVLLPSLENAEVKEILIKQAESRPAIVLPRLLSLNPSRNQPAAMLILELLAVHPDWLAQVKPCCDEAQQKTLQRLLEIEQMEEAAEEELPEILRQPPWRSERKLMDIPRMDLPIRHTPAVVHWAKPEQTGNPGDDAALVEKAFQQELQRHKYLTETAQQWPMTYKVLYLSHVKPDAIEQVVNTGKLENENLNNSYIYSSLRQSQLALLLPKPLAEQVFLSMTPRFFAWFYFDEVANYRLIEWLGDVAVVRIAELLQHSRLSVHALKHLGNIESVHFSIAMATLMQKNKWAKPIARAWLLRFPATAVRGLIPAVLGTNAELNSIAQRSLHWLQEQGMQDVIVQEATAYGDAANQAIRQILTISPAHILPAKLPAPPKNLPLQILPRLLLKANGRAIPLNYVSDVLMTFLLSKADEPYVALSWLQEELQPDSLARFGQGLFKWWMQHEAPSKERWIFDVQGLIGNDETARLLNTALRQWRAALNRVRAYDALNMLAQIGSDVALMYLDALSKQTRFNDLHDRATRLMEEVAEQRGLTQDQLADRTVPDFGLDEHGILTLDFGPRQFVLRFNEALQPRLEDDNGKMIKTLPKPNAKDDPERAKLATTLCSDVRKQAKAVATMQLKRLEAAMCAQRRWSVDEFTTFFVSHRLSRHIAQALVWGCFDAQNKLLSVFRVAEDLTLADAEDNVYQLPRDAQIGIAHRLQLSKEQLEIFAQILADYKKIQPFQQLAREIYLPAAEELHSHRLSVWGNGHSVTSASLLGLEQRGWNRRVGDDGMIYEFTKSLDEQCAATLRVSPGWHVSGPPDSKEVHEIEGVVLNNEQQTWGKLSPISYSEVQRDLHLMAWFV